MVFSLVLANNDTLLRVFFYLLIIDLQFLISAVIAQLFNPIEELLTRIGIPIKGAKRKTETHPVITESKIRKCST